MSITEMKVHMCCPGCEAKIKKALLKLEGIDNIDIDMNMQKVTVTGWAEQKKVLKAARKTGRRAELWPFPYTPEYNAYSEHYYHQHQPGQPYAGFKPQPSSSYNYYKHGYDGNEHGYYHHPAHSTIVNEHAGAIFSDENPHACSIM
ncbi:Heavy metal-associated isoprenylated plant protein [Thalictrum thalictroides]|uniref:Heavy metal-associated isoprenylated plant protein n=1 Tax=Thalictrum thalictroides TaxID=46969 RepID=A0A7J6XDH3_THATH|nr:Heavy metal-associated isoprenylated plant protein [Thalictrum thalictroides]